MSKISYLLTLVLLLILYSFKPTGNLVRIKEEINLNSKLKEYYTYTKDGQIASQSNSLGDTTLYEYAKDKIIMRTLRNNTIDTIQLNSRGYAENYKEKHLFYDDNGFKVYENSIVGTFYWSVTNDNITTYTKETSPTLISTYSYYYDKENYLSDTNRGQLFLGRDSKNLLNQIVIVGGNGDTLLNLSNQYLFDTLGRVTKRFIYNSKRTEVDSFAYSYY